MQLTSSRAPSRPWIWLWIAAGLVALAWLLTYLAGGTKTPLPHAFYVPIVVAAGASGLRAGLSFALIAGFLCGPLMPLNVETGQPQPTSGWLIRLGFFLLIALVVGVGRNRLLELVNARQNFLSSVSHELRTPLASVVGFATLLTDRSDELTAEERHEFVSLILRESTELANVVDHYVIEGRLSDSALFIDAQPTDLRRLIDVVIEGLPGEVRDRRIAVRGPNVMCVADPLRLRQVLRSMVNNALAYTSARIVVAVSADRHEARVRVSELQPGPGSESGQPMAGTMVRNSELATVPPLGVGLSVSRDLVRRMGGHLEYQVNGRVDYAVRLPLHTS